MTTAATRRRSKWAGARRVRPRVLVGAAIVVLAIVVAARATLAATSSGSPSYRTALVGRGQVSETIHRPGTIEAVAQAAVAFPLAGTVASVAAHVGDDVVTGQPLATLDTTSLQAALATRQAAVVAARLTLAKALDGQSSSSAGASSSRAGAAAPVAVAVASSPGDDARLSSAQQEVLADQQQVDADLHAAQLAMQTAAAACREPSTSATTTTAATATAATSATATTMPTAPSDDASASGLGTAGCMEAQQQVLAYQQIASGSQHDLATAESALDEQLTTAASASSAATGRGSTGGTGSTGARSSGSDTGSSSGTTPAPSPAGAEELVADQSAVDAAIAEVAVAQQNLDQATIVSPIAGTVAAVDLAPGQQVPTASATATVVVVGAGGDEVTTTVAVADIAKVKVDDPAAVVPDGTATTVVGRVVSVGVGATTSGTTTTYPVVIGFDQAPNSLRNGASAAVTIEVAKADATLTVPTSAVRLVGSQHLVTMVSGAKATLTRIEVGVVGAELTQVTSGLQAGQAVMLADLGQPLPSSDTANRFRPGAGGLAGGGGLGGARVRPGGG